MLLYIIRHGDPNYDLDALTPKGKQQADALANRLALQGLDRIFSSPMGRARETAQPTCDLLGLPCEIEEWTREVWDDFALTFLDGHKEFCMDIENTNYRNEKALHLEDKWYMAKALQTIDGKKGFEKIIKNSDAFFKRLGYERQKGLYKIIKPNEERIAVFCHGGFGLTWMAHLLQIPPHIFWAGFAVTHTGVSIFEFQNFDSGFTAPKCLCFSDTSHLYKENLTLQSCNRIDL